MKIWLDIENPPQVQYLTPFVDAFARKGHRVVITARDHGMALELLRLRGVAFSAVGRQPGLGRRRKVLGTMHRAWQLQRHIRLQGGAQLLLGGSRSGALAARLLGIPAFAIIDYEHVELSSYRRLGVTVLFPSVIGTDTFARKGFSADQLIPFAGLKEDFSFTGQDLTAGEPRLLADVPPDLHRVLIRPPAEDSHYFASTSRLLIEGSIQRLARRPDVQVVLAPRRPEQRALVDSCSWTNNPIVLERAVPFTALLRSVDCVVCSGGTMLREAAYLGVPAVGAFSGPTGGVDKYLESIGAAHLVRKVEELDKVDWTLPRKECPVTHNASLVDEVSTRLLTHAAAKPGSRSLIRARS